MISFLRELDGRQLIIAEPEFSTGHKWKHIARHTERLYDTPTDVLPLVLRRRQARFIADSRLDVECDRDLCKHLHLISQYIMPLATDSLSIGTIQVDLGEQQEMSVEECTMLVVSLACLVGQETGTEG